MTSARGGSASRRRKEVIGFISVECPGQPLDVENTSPIYPDEVLRGVERRISGLGWSVLVTFWNGEAGRDLGQIAAMPGKVDGILISIGSFPARLVEPMARRVPVAVIAGDPCDRSPRPGSGYRNRSSCCRPNWC